VVYHSPHTHNAYRFSAVNTGKSATVENTMNKKLVTLAVAAALAAPAVASADAVLYGKLNVGISYMNQDNGFQGWGLSDNRAMRGWDQTIFDLDGWANYSMTVRNPFITTPQGPSNRLGVKGSEDLGNGLKAIYQIELGFSLSDSNNSAANLTGSETITMRNTFVGLSGNFGTVLAGRHDTPLKISTGPLDLFADTMADYNNTVGFQDLRADNAIAYISPSFSGFQVAAAVVAGGGATAVGVYNPDANSLADAYSLAAIYKNGPWYASLAYEGLKAEMADLNRDNETWNKWRVGLGILDWNGFTLTGIYEGWQNGLWADGQDANLWNVQAGYTFGQIMIKAAYGSNTQSGDWAIPAGTFTNPFGKQVGGLWAIDDYNFKTWSFGLDYNMSKRTKAFALYTDNSSDDLYDNFDALKDYSIKWQGFQLGMMHSF
jgi:predicted porin